jgi:NAD(P)-dependent dehydrogenase (short-subunit alcohol dehydrogenase family)
MARPYCDTKESSSLNNILNENKSMQGKRVIITGPTSGIGKEIALQLAALGAELVLACRDLGRGKSTADEIAQRTGASNCTVMHVDTSSQQSIREFAREVRERLPRLDVLVNNAGVNRARREMSVDGIELTLATNVLGYFLLTQELLDLLSASAPARIVNVASTFAGELDLDDLQFERRPYSGQNAYKQSKACNRMLTWALARRLQDSRVTANAMAPGLVIRTGLYDQAPAAGLYIMRALSHFIGRTPTQGADTAVWLASCPEVQAVTGKFFDRRRERACEFRNIEAEEKLWSICQKLAGAA